LAPAPISLDGLDYAGFESTTSVVSSGLPEGRLDLWHLTQVPAGATLVVPLANDHDSEALSYANAGSWQHLDDQVRWAYSGTENAKLGLSAAALTGRAGVLYRQDESWIMLVRDFPIEPQERYIDHPFGAPRTDQTFQAWDGFGFGEMEFHSPGITSNYLATDRLWAFRGDDSRIRHAARELLGVNVDEVLAGGAPAAKKFGSSPA